MLPLIPDVRALLIGAAVGAIVAGIAAWTVNGWRLESRYTSLQRNIAEQQAEAQGKARAAELDASVALAEISEKLHAAEVKNERIENERDAAIAAGAQRVYVRAACPASMSADATTTGSIDGAGAELDPAYRQALSDLRRGAAACVEQIAGLQQYALACRPIKR